MRTVLFETLGRKGRTHLGKALCFAVKVLKSCYSCDCGGLEGDNRLICYGQEERAGGLKWICTAKRAKPSKGRKQFSILVWLDFFSSNVISGPQPREKRGVKTRQSRDIARCPLALIRRKVLITAVLRMLSAAIEVHLCQIHLVISLLLFRSPLTSKANRCVHKNHFHHHINSSSTSSHSS